MPILEGTNALTCMLASTSVDKYATANDTVKTFAPSFVYDWYGENPGNAQPFNEDVVTPTDVSESNKRRKIIFITFQQKIAFLKMALAAWSGRVVSCLHECSHNQ